MRSAFLEYDLSKNLDLNEAQSQIVAYFPLDEIGEKAEFLLSNPAACKALAKEVITSLKPSNKKRAVLTVQDIVYQACPKVFTQGLRAHMSMFSMSKRV